MRKWLEKWAESYTKRIVSLILFNSIIWIYCSYFLAYLGRYEIAEDLSGKVVTTVIATLITYSVKAFAEKTKLLDVRKLKNPKKQEEEKQDEN